MNAAVSYVSSEKNHSTDFDLLFHSRPANAYNSTVSWILEKRLSSFTICAWTRSYAAHLNALWTFNKCSEMEKKGEEGKKKLSIVYVRNISVYGRFG